MSEKGPIDKWRVMVQLICASCMSAHPGIYYLGDPPPTSCPCCNMSMNGVVIREEDRPTPDDLAVPDTHDPTFAPSDADSNSTVEGE